MSDLARRFAKCLGLNLLAILAVAVIFLMLADPNSKESIRKPSNAPSDQITCVDALYIGIC